MDIYECSRRASPAGDEGERELKGDRGVKGARESVTELVASGDNIPLDAIIFIAGQYVSS